MNDYWFKPKERGIGAGVPLNWKGWALFGVYLAVIVTTPKLLEMHFGYEADWLTRLAAVILISIPFLALAWTKTEGGWRWRNSDDS